MESAPVSMTFGISLALRVGNISRIQQVVTVLSYVIVMGVTLTLLSAVFAEKLCCLIPPVMRSALLEEGCTGSLDLLVSVGCGVGVVDTATLVGAGHTTEVTAGHAMAGTISLA